MERTKPPKGPTKPTPREGPSNKEVFKNRYDKLREVKRTARVNMKQFVWLPKLSKLSKGVTFTTSSGISKPAIVVYPVLCTEADFEKRSWLQISEENLARLTGINAKSVRDGINDITDNAFYFECDGKKEFLLARKMESEGRRHYYVYRPGFVRGDMIKEFRGNFFSFHRCIVTSGVWGNLTLRAKLLYLAIRSEAKFDTEFYLEVEEGCCDKHLADFTFQSEDYLQRKWDVCDTPIASLCRMVGIESTNLKPVWDQLEHFGLVERYGPTLKVYLKPNRMVRF